MVVAGVAVAGAVVAGAVVGADPAGAGAEVGAGAVVGVSVLAGDGVVGVGEVGDSVGAPSGLGRRITTIPGSIPTTPRQTWFTPTRLQMTEAFELRGDDLSTTLSINRVVPT